jgi:prolyl oligopeptidase
MTLARRICRTTARLLTLCLPACAVEPNPDATPKEPPAAGLVAAGLARPETQPVEPRVLPPFAAPPVRRQEVFDDYHGTQVEDPYRWLEDPVADQTRAFVAAQNTASRAFLDAVPARAAIRARLEELWNYPRRSAPMHYGKHWFWTANDGLQNQSVWYVDDSPTGPGRLLLDPNTLHADGAVSLAGFQPSDDGSLVAYAIARGGSDWQEWHVLDTATQHTLPDTLQWAKFTGAAWTADGRGFFYQRFPAPTEGEERQAANRTPQVCYHRIGTPQGEDLVVYERPDQPEWGFDAEVTESGRFLVVNVWAGSSTHNRIVFADLTQEGWPVHPLRMEGDASYDFLGHDGDQFWFRTDKDAPRGRIVAIDRREPDAAARTLVAEQRDTLEGATVRGGHFVCIRLADASHRIAVHTPDGAHVRDLQLPALGSVGGFTGRVADPDCYFVFQSFAHAPTILRHDFTSGATEIHRPSAIRFDPSGIVTTRQFLQSADGTRLCLFLVHKQGLRLDGGNPTYLIGYGGFNASMTPGFSVATLAWLERGGVLAQAVLRGGGEYGEDWHRAGMLGNKQNVFDDFAACARYLTRNGYARPDRLAIGGASNGGLLVGALLTQHPELFGAAIPEAGVLDMLRFHQFTIGWAWVPEYGSSADPEQFQWLFRYSPLHRVQPGTSYPPTMVMTGDHDDRVLPGHSFKFAAALQHAQGGSAPVLLRVETDTGHGAGTPTQKQIDEAADRWAFLTAVLGA